MPPLRTTRAPEDGCSAKAHADVRSSPGGDRGRATVCGVVGDYTAVSYSTSSGCVEQMFNFLELPTPAACAERMAMFAKEHYQCSPQFMFSTAYEGWGCRCCAPGEAAGGETNRYWDVFSMQKGFFLRCALGPFASSLPHMQAAAPDRFELALLRDGSTHEVGATYELGRDVGSCNCAEPWLELRRRQQSLTIWQLRGALPGVDEAWFHFGGACSDMGLRRCTTAADGPILAPDTVYFGRLRITCSNAGSIGEYAYSEVVTRPGCPWSSHSGVFVRYGGEEFQCADGSFCPAEEAGCCSARGGPLRCPPSAPIMCEDAHCAPDVAGCAAHGGRRSCGRLDPIPAPPPRMVSVVIPLQPASMTIGWEPGTYLNGASTCVFSRWLIQVAEASRSGNESVASGPWFAPQVNCALQDRGTRSCHLLGVEQKTWYVVRVSEVCADPTLTSPPGEMAAPLETLPWRAGSPPAIYCVTAPPQPLRTLETNFPHPYFPRTTAHSTLNVTWVAGSANNCEFSHWEVDAMLLPREQDNDNCNSV